MSAHRERIRAKRKVGFAYRVIVAVIGTAIVIMGLAAVPLPGPGWLIVFIGLGVLASEFTWAERLLDYAKKRVEQWADWLRAQSLAVRLAILVGTVMIVAAAIYGYHQWRGLPSWIPGIG